jgi:hypothetical protein
MKIDQARKRKSTRPTVANTLSRSNKLYHYPIKRDDYSYLLPLLMIFLLLFGIPIIVLILILFDNL